MLTVNEFRHAQFCFANATDICPMSGTNVLIRHEIDYASDWDMWKYFFALSMMAIGLLCLAYIQLFRIKKTK